MILHYFEFETNDEKYIISFDSKGSSFIYDVKLEVGKRIIDIRRKIDQSKEYYQTIEHFIKALEKNGEESLIDELYKETIALYSIKKGFSFLIIFFLKIYQKSDLCSELLKIFKKINGDKNENSKNMDRKPILKEYTSIFKSINSDANKIIETYNYNPIEFYGIVLSYLNHYDYENFSLTVNELFNKKPDHLFEILLIYNANFKNPINQNIDFFNEFIKYSILNKEFSSLLKGLDYIRDICTFLSIINKNKEEIHKKYNLQKIEKIIKIGDLKFKKDKKEEIESQKDKEPKTPTLSINSKKNLNQNTEEINTGSNNKDENNINKVLKNIKAIINYCKENKTFLIYFTNNFWSYILSYYNEPKQNNIYICFQLRELFKKYNELVDDIYNLLEKKDKVKMTTIKKEANSYFERDEFAFILAQMITKYNNKSEVSDIEKLAFITGYNPYYIEPKYSNKVDCSIFDTLDLNQIDEKFIEDFKRRNFETIFKDNISEYIKKILGKIKDIPHFNKIIKLINIEKLTDKNIYLDLLKKRYDNIIHNEIGLLSDEALKEAVCVSAKIAIINYSYETKEKKFEFIKSRIKKLEDRIIPLIFIEIINQCFNENEKDIIIEEEEEQTTDESQIIIKEEKNNTDFNEMKKFIFNEFSTKLDNENDIDNIIKLIDCLEGKGTKKEKEENKEAMIEEFLQILLSKNLFAKDLKEPKDDFFSSSQSLRILLLIRLYEKGKIRKSDKSYYDNIISLIDFVIKDLDGEIKKSKLEEFLKNEKSVIIERLKIISLIISGFNPEDKYEDLKKKNDDINEDLNNLKDIKDNIIIYHKDSYQDLMKKIIDVLKTNQNKRITEYRGGIKELIKEAESKNLPELTRRIKEVKDFLLFNVIYDENSGKDDKTNFDYAYKTLTDIGDYLKSKTDIIELNNKHKDIFKKIKEKLSNNEEEANIFIENLKKYYKISNTNLIDELTILFKSKKYELDIKSIIFFFENYFDKDNKEWNEKLPKVGFEKYWEEDFKTIKDDLNKLKDNGIYEYKNIGNYNKLFTCLYDKEEAIDFLFKTTSENINKLKDKIQPTDRTIEIKDITDTEVCVAAISTMKNKIQDNFKIFNYIKSMDEKTISQFENYSKIYSSVIELNTNQEDLDGNIYEKIIGIITDATFNILQDSQNFLYYDDKENKNKKITMKQLIRLKNQIHIKNQKEDKDDDLIKSKCKILLFFKEIMSGLEVINGYMRILRRKGSSLPIKISIKIKVKEKEPIQYFFGRNKSNLKEIRKFLFEAKNAYISQLDAKYKEKLNLRFLYGRQFRTIMKHLENILLIERTLIIAFKLFKLKI